MLHGFTIFANQLNGLCVPLHCLFSPVERRWIMDQQDLEQQPFFSRR